MSGIYGVVHFNGQPVDPEMVAIMGAAAAYRGPHGSDRWVEGCAGLGHLALHTTPEAVQEHQPLHDFRHGLVMVADARVDNRPELAAILNAKGCLTQDAPTDADLILAAYGCWGEDCVKNIIGDFSIAIWDRSMQSLFCVSDPFGNKPLYYSYNDHVLYFASDFRQFMVLPEISKDLDGYKLADYLSYNYSDKVRTLFAAIQRISPGYSFVFSSNSPRCQRYWDPINIPALEYREETEYIEHFHDLLSRCVMDRMRSRSGVVGILTSGGMDSTSIAALAQTHYKRGIGISQPVSYNLCIVNHPDDDRRLSQLLAKEIGIELHLVDVPAGKPYSIFSPPPDINCPMQDDARVLPVVLNLLAQRNCDVVLNGEGGDELFSGGYKQPVDDLLTGRWLQLRKWIQFHRHNGRPLRQAILLSCIWPLVPYTFRINFDRIRGRQSVQPPPWLHKDLLSQARPVDRLHSYKPPRRYRSWTRQAQYAQTINLVHPGNLGPQNDLFGCQAGMEFRYPFLDRRLFEFALAIPTHLLAQPVPSGGKWILRQAMRGLIPEEIRCRLKSPYLPRTDSGAIEQELLKNEISELRELFTSSILIQRRAIDDIIFNKFLCKFWQEPNRPEWFLVRNAAKLEVWLRTNVLSNQTIQFKELQCWQIVLEDQFSSR